MLRHYHQRIQELLQDHQFAAGRPGGAEQLSLLLSALHADQRHRRLHPGAAPEEPLLLLNIDIANAFNTVSRRYVLEALVRQDFQGLLPLVMAKYEGETEITLPGSSEAIAAILSREGVQQGDSLAMFLFALVLVDVVSALRQSRSVARRALLSVFFADDGFLVGPPSVVLSALELLSSLLSVGDAPVPARPLQRSARALIPGATGLSLALTKCRVFCLGDGEGVPAVAPATVETLQALEQRGVLRVPGVKVLGTPIGTEAFVQDSLAATLRDGLFSKINALNQLEDDYAAYSLLHQCVDKSIGHLLRSVVPSVIGQFAEAKDDAVLEFFQRRARILPGQSDHVRAVLYRRHDLGGFGCVSAAATKDAAFLGALAASLQPLLLTARRARWPPFVGDAVDPAGPSSFWAEARTTWASCARVWKDGHQAAAALRAEHGIDSALLPLKGARARTSSSGSPPPASSPPSSAPVAALDPAAPSTSRMMTRSQSTAVARAPSTSTSRARARAGTSTTTPRATTAGTTTRTTATTAGAAALDEFPELKDYSDTAFYQLQRALTQRINYIALRASLCIPVGEATAARRAAAASAANRIGKASNPFQSSYASTVSTHTSLSGAGVFADGVHLWLGIPSQYHVDCLFAPCICGTTAADLVPPADNVTPLDRALAMRTHRLGCQWAGARNRVHDAIVDSLYQMGIGAYGGYNVEREKELAVPVGFTPNASTVHPRADVIFSEVPCVITDPSRVEQLTVEVKTSDALSASNLEYFNVQERRGDSLLKARPLVNRDALRRRAENQYRGWIPAGSRLVTVVADMLGAIDADLCALVQKTASVQLAQDQLVTPNMPVDKDAAGVHAADLLGRLARARLRAAVFAERDRLGRQLAHHNGVYVRPRDRVLPLPGRQPLDRGALGRRARRLRAQGEYPLRLAVPLRLHRPRPLAALPGRAPAGAAPEDPEA